MQSTSYTVYEDTVWGTTDSILGTLCMYVSRATEYLNHTPRREAKLVESHVQTPFGKVKNQYVCTQYMYIAVFACTGQYQPIRLQSLYVRDSNISCPYILLVLILIFKLLEPLLLIKPVATSSGPTQKSGKEPGHTCKNSCMCILASLLTLGYKLNFFYSTVTPILTTVTKKAFVTL